MGTIRQAFIKRQAHVLIEKYPDKFSSDFNKNKISIKELGGLQSKIVQNRVAGYIARCLSHETL